SWLNDRDRGALLGFLADVPVDRSRWFGDWVQRRPELRFRRWDRIGFYPPGYQGATTEAMPLLTSEPFVQFGSVRRLSGGVSLAPKELFKGRAALSEGFEQTLRRSNVNYSTAKAGGREFKTFQETQYSFKTLGERAAALDAVPKAGTKLRGRVSE